MQTIEEIFEKAINDIKKQKKALSKDLVIAKLLIIKEQVKQEIIKL
jgi:hypothetical protein